MVHTQQTDITIRAPTLADLHAVVELVNACSVAEGGQADERADDCRAPGHSTAGSLPADLLPRQLCRHRLTIDGVMVAPIAESRVLLISGTSLNKEPGRSAMLFAAELAQRSSTTVALDIDFRPDQWHDPRAFGIAIRSALRSVDLVIGTDDELNAAMLDDPGQSRCTTFSARATRSRRACCMATCRGGIGTKQRVWAMPAGPSS